MKVIKISLRTPGILLSKTTTYDKENLPYLVLQVNSRSGAKDEDEDWEDINEFPDITVLAKNVDEPCVLKFIDKLPTGSVEVPLQDDEDRTRVFSLLVNDGQKWKYRIIAFNCLTCRQLYPNDVITWKEKPGVIVKRGEIQS